MPTETQINAFIKKYTPEIQAQLRAARTRLRALFPRGYELVYDNYNALAIGYAPSERASQVVLSIAGYPKWITLFFLDGVHLKDPHRQLQGSGNKVRSLRLAAADQIDEPNVRAFIKQALASHKKLFAATPALETIIKSVSARQRPRRPAKASVAK